MISLAALSVSKCISAVFFSAFLKANFDTVLILSSFLCLNFWDYNSYILYAHRLQTFKNPLTLLCSYRSKIIDTPTPPLYTPILSLETKPT